MNAVRQIVDGNALSQIVKLPKHMQSGQVEVIVLPTTQNRRLQKIKNPRLLREPDPSKSTRLGQWNGEVTIPDDFDEPLEDMKEYMY